MENQPLISLCMIVKNEEDIIERCLNSVKFIVDEYCILDTGSTDKTIEIIENFTKTPVFKTEFKNFVDTKNEVLEKATGKYILWMDADEIMGNPCFLRVRSYAEEGVDAVILNKMEGDLSYFKYRLWPNRKDIRFAGPYTHEYLNYNIRSIFDENIRVLEIPKPNKDWTFKFKRDIELIRKYLNEVNPNDPRGLFYLAQSYRSLGDTTALNVYSKYLNVAVFDDEIFWSYYQMANIYFEQMEYDNALNILNEAEKKFNNRAELYYLRGLIYYNLQEWEKAIENFEKIKNLTPPKIIGFLDLTKYDFNNVKEYLVNCYFQLNNYIESKKYLNEINNKADNLIIISRILENRIPLKIAMFMGPFPKKIYGGILFHEGIYGTETAYIELAETFAKYGMEVYLFTSIEVDFKFKNVNYINYNKFFEYKEKIKFDVVINSRHNIFNENEDFIKIMWMHDLYLEDNLPYYKFDYLVCSTKFHKNFLIGKFQEKINKDKIKVIPLSLNNYYYQNIDLNKKDPYKIIYSSSLDRGILNYLPYFEKLLEKNNKFKLYLYYGTDISKQLDRYGYIENYIENSLNNYLNYYKNYLINKGRLNKKQLAQEKIEATYGLYPSNFLETFGITLLENQCAGMVTITNKIGAITNTLNLDYNYFITGNISNDLVIEQYNETILYLHNNPEILKQKQLGNLEYIKNNFKTWNDIGKQWLQFLYNIKYSKK